MKSKKKGFDPKVSQAVAVCGMVPPDCTRIERTTNSSLLSSKQENLFRIKFDPSIRIDMLTQNEVIGRSSGFGDVFNAHQKKR